MMGSVAHRSEPGVRALPAPRASFAESLAGADQAADAQRRRGLRRMKAVALGFLLGATVVYLVCTWAQSQGASAAPWIGYVRAAAEAGMVGALADWFAVTALFRHPLGIPIPHTAIIKRKKDQLGEGLGDRKSTRLNSSHSSISYAVFCLKKKKKKNIRHITNKKQ